MRSPASQLGLNAARAWSRWPKALKLGSGLSRDKVDDDALEGSIYHFILSRSLGEQIFLVVLTLLSFPFLYYSLDLPKTIVNRAIGGKAFPQEVLGIKFDQIPYLLILCAIFLVLVLINGWFKYYINVRKGQLGERMLRQLRFELCERILRFPLSHFNRISAGEIIAMITAELEPLGGFIGDAFALPIFQTGTLLTTLGFMFIQNATLGAAAVALYPLQAYVIPKLQRKVRQLGRERVRTTRRLADRIGETIAGRVDIRVNDAAPHQLANLSGWLGRIYELRFDIYNRKFFVKFLNNFINQITPFFFYAIGGFLVIEGQLSLGSLVAVLAAYKDLSAPWKELLDFYQQQQDVAIKYEQVVEQFQVPDMLARNLLVEQPRSLDRFSGTVAVMDLTLIDPDGAPLLEMISFSFELGEHVAIVGSSDSGKSTLAQLLARLNVPTSGRITIGGVDINTLPLAVTGRRLGYVGPASYLFSTTLRENLLLGLQHPPMRRDDGADEPSEAVSADAEATELQRTEHWIDYRQAGVADEAELDARIHEVLQLVALEDDVYTLGLYGRLDTNGQREEAQRILQARAMLQDRLAKRGLTRLVERFDRDRYIANASVGENLLFGTPVGPVLDVSELAANSYMLSVLDELDLTGDLLRIGGQVADMMLEIFADLQHEHEFLEEFSLIQSNEVPEFEAILPRLKRAGPDGLLPDQRKRLLSVALKIVAARHRLGFIDDRVQARIVEARRRFATNLPPELKGAVEFYDASRYSAAATIEDNILFGKIAYGEAHSRELVRAVVAEVVGELGLKATVIEVGLGYHVGSGGSRLSLAQRQKVAIARTVLKRPDLMILNEATAVLDESAQAAILDGLRHEFDGRSLAWCLHRVSEGRHFDRILMMRQGRLVAQGTFEEVERSEAVAARPNAAE